MENKPTYKVVPHIAMLQFARATVFAPVTEEAPPIPYHRFYFIEFDQLQHRVQSTEILSGKIKLLSLKKNFIINVFINTFNIYYLFSNKCYWCRYKSTND